MPRTRGNIPRRNPRMTPAQREEVRANREQMVIDKLVAASAKDIGINDINRFDPRLVDAIEAVSGVEFKAFSQRVKEEYDRANPILPASAQAGNPQE